MTRALSLALVALLASGCASDGFRHRGSALAARLGAPRHVVLDTVTASGVSATVRARLAYGLLRKDLEDEWASLSIHREGAWVPVGRARSDDDGLVEFEVPGALLELPGEHLVALLVDADGTRAYGSVWVLETGAPVAIFDIDGTLTRGGIAQRILLRTPIQVRPGAVEIVRRQVEAGAQPVYLTGRSFAFEGYTRRWLAKGGFAPGPLIVSPETASGFPWSDIADFKAAWLRQLQATVAPDIRAAFGDSETDARAYDRAGIPADRTFLWSHAAPAFDGAEAADGGPVAGAGPR